MAQQGIPTGPKQREFRGLLLAQEGGIAALVSRRESLTTSFNFLSPVPSFQNNYWVGYTMRTVAESLSGSRAARLVYEHLGHDGPKVRKEARTTGFCETEQLLPYQRKLLRLDEPFH